MAGKDLKVALQITADLNQARREVKAFNEDLGDSSKAAEATTKAQQKISKTSVSTADSIKKMSSATDMQDGVKQLNVYDRQLNKVVGSSEQFAQSNNKVLDSLKGFAPQLLSISAASAGFIAIAMDTVNKASELKNQSALGGLSVEEFQYYAAGAQSVGIQTEKLGDIFKDTRDKVGDFLATGGGELQNFFETIAPKVGVTAEQFKKLNGAESLQLIFDSLKKTGMSDNEIVFYLESVADEATALVPLLEKSGEGFKKLGDKAKASGAILSQSMVNDAVAAKNAMADVQNQVTGLTNKMVANAAPAITFLAQNLDVLAQAGMIVGSVYMARLAPSIIESTKATIVELTTKGQAIFMSKARATALLTEASAAQVAAAAELKSAQAAMAVAATGSAQATAQTRLTAARVADTAATLAQSRAQEVYNVTMSRSRLGAGALMGALGGPVGLAITAAGVAASFLLMKDSSAQVTPVLDIQAQSVDELRIKYEKLSAIQKDTALHEVKKQVEETSLKFKVASSDLSAFIEALPISDEKINTYRKLNTQFVQGKITADQYYTALKNGNVLSEEQINTARKLITAYGTTKSTFDTTKQAQEALTSSSQTASTTNTGLSSSLNDVGMSAKGAKSEITGLTKAFEDYKKKSVETIFSNTMQKSLINKGYSEETSKALVDARVAKGVNLTAKETNLVLLEQNAVKELNDLKEKQKKQEEAITKQKEKQAKISEQTATINSKVMAYAKQYNTEQLEAQRGLPRGLIAATAMQESRGDRFAKSPVGAEGIMQFMPKTAVRFSLKDRTNVAESFRAAADYYQVLLKKFNGDLDKAIMAYNAGEGNVESGKAYGFKETQKYLPAVKKYLAGYNGLDDENAQSNLGKMLSAEADTIKKQEQQKQNQLANIEFYYTEEEKLTAEHEKQMKKLNEAGHSPQELKKLVGLENKRYEDALSKRPEILKRVQDSLSSLNESWLRASDHDLAADLNAVDEKWKQTKADLASLMMSEPNAVQANQYQEMLVKIDFVIDKEKLTLQFNDAMKQLEELQSLRSQRQDTLKVQYDSGQISRYQYADGLRSIDTEMKPQMQGLIDLAGQLAEKMGDAFNVERIKSMNAELNQSDKELSKFLPTADQVIERIASGMTDAIMAWADGTKSASQAFKEFASSFLREIAQMILKQIIFNALKSITGYSDGGLVTGFSSGGYTGAGGKYDPAGVVHKDEFVIRKESTNQAGAKEFLSYFNRYGMDALNKFKGYADGGLVAAPQVNLPNIPTPKVANPAEQIANSTSFSANQNFYLVDDPARILDVLKSGASQENLVVMMSRDPAKFKSALKIG